MQDKKSAQENSMTRLATATAHTASHMAWCRVRGAIWLWLRGEGEGEGGEEREREGESTVPRQKAPAAVDPLVSRRCLALQC